MTALTCPVPELPIFIIPGIGRLRGWTVFRKKNLNVHAEACLTRVWKYESVETTGKRSSASARLSRTIISLFQSWSGGGPCK